MNLLRYLIAAGVFILADPAAHAQNLWLTYALGMSVDDVRHAAPDATAVDDAKLVLPDGARTKLRIANIEIAGRPFSVDFMFTDDKLSHVQLKYIGDDSADAIRSTQTDLVTALRSKYGIEVSRATNNATWISGQTNVTLTTYVFGRSGILQVDYSAGVSKAANKL